MDQRWQRHRQVLARAWRVRDRARAGQLRVALLVAALVISGGAAYTVRSGDTLGELAQKFGVSTGDLAEANGITNPDLIIAGQVLQIPGGDHGSAGGRGGKATTHVVAGGESLSSIAARYGLSVADLAAANGITDVDRVLAGALLRVSDTPPPTPGLRSGTRTYTVTRGDALSSIAARFSTTAGALVKANGLDDPNRIYAGQTLKVPGHSGPQWQCPVPDATFINDFGVAKPDGRHHEGVDMFAPRGTLIYAPVGGQLKTVRGNRAGMQVTLLGEDGYTYIGAHLDAYRDAGRVAQGDPIGTVGNTGNARGGPTHLHFEMHNGGVVNPFPTLTKFC